MSDNERNDDLDTAAKARGRKLGERRSPQRNDALDQLTDEELREMLKSRGLEVRKKRKTPGAMSRAQDVPGKNRLTVHMPEELVKSIKRAALEINCSESSIVSEACQRWMDASNLRVA